MTNDQTTFKRGATAAAIGLGVQIVLFLVALVGALAVVSPGVTAAAWHFFAGLPIWIILLMIYNQHRLERIEALETEQLARADAEAGAIFDEHAEELQLSRRRLDRLYKWGLGGVSVLVAAYLMIVGIAMFVANYRAFEDGTLSQGIVAGRMLGGAAAGGVLAVASLALALVMFLIARYVSGMTKIKQWQLLRGGASFLMGNAVVAVLVGIAAAWLYFDADSPNRTLLFEYLALIVPAILGLIGTEIALTFLLSAYRPRRPGEVPRPAFDSRLLGFLTSPESLGRIVAETINYQFGFEISRSWFYQLLARAVTPLVVFGALALVALSCVVVVQPHQQAVMTRVGAYQGTVGPGLHLKLPWPMADAEKYSVQRVHQISVGSIEQPPRQGVPVLWTTQHAVGIERPLVAAAVPRTGDQRSESDDETDVQPMSLVAAEVVVQFRVRDLKKFVTRAPEPEKLEQAARQRDEFARRRPPGPEEGEKLIDPCPLLTAIAERCVTEYFASKDIDTLLSSGRRQAGTALQQRIQAAVDDPELDLGLEIVQVGLTQVHPPQNQSDEESGLDPVPETFHESIAAKQEKESEIQLARQEEAKILSTVAGSKEKADRIDAAIARLDALKEARADAEAIKAADLEVKLLLEEEAGGTAAQVIYQAWAARWSESIGALAEAERFTAELKSYELAPDYYKQRTYYQQMAELTRRARRIVFPRPRDGRPNVIELNLEDAGSGLENVLSDN